MTEDIDELITRVKAAASQAMVPDLMALQAAIAQLRNNERRAFDMLNHYGVPRTRARSVANGIMVLVTRMDRELEAERLRTPGRFQIGDTVCYNKQKATVLGVTATTMDFDDDWGPGGKILYDLQTPTGRRDRVLSNDVSPMPVLVVTGT